MKGLSVKISFVCFLADMLIRMIQQESSCSSPLQILNLDAAPTSPTQLKTPSDFNLTVAECDTIFQ